MTYNPSSVININGTRISEADPVYFVAEIGSNFDQDLSRAKDLIFLAKEAGADAVKFQHYTAKSLVSDIGFKELGKSQSHQSVWKKSVFETYQSASLNRHWTEALKNTCDKAGVAFFTSPYSLELVDYVDRFVAAYKIGSGDITWLKIIELMASKAKPIILATGASNIDDVKRAVQAILSRNSDLVLMQCNTNYTANIKNSSFINLNVINTYKSLYPGIILGLSDHLPGHVSVLGAVSLGARVIEKHFTDSTDREGPDHAFALDPISWREMVTRTRELEVCLGKYTKEVEGNEKETVVLQRRCVRAARDINRGDILTLSDFEVLRPCPRDGIAPYDIEKLVGRTINRCLGLGDYLKWADVE